MASSQDLKQRTKPHDSSPADADAGAAAAATTTKVKLRRPDRRTMAKRGLRSLALAVSLPLSLTLIDIYFFGSLAAASAAAAAAAAEPERPFVPPLWILHTLCAVSSLLMGLSAWLVWAEGGFHRRPVALPLYLAQLGLALAWGPVVFGLGAGRVGLAVAAGMVAAMVGCYKTFGEVNPIAGDLVKICFAWAGLLSVVNLKLVSM
ncbi:translocator protein homolog [Syzygium oleosum]|uniref:translocator protein homolog n=1 Tax=Syzygium oleosum TaxID=219896 RepID=UPI0011D21581|nr:translocator protein homolog [Syzygium oleosum]